MNKVINYGRQDINDEDIQSVVDVLKSDWLTQGPNVKNFEEGFSEYIGSKFAVAVSNGTAALHLSVLALNLKPGDKVITTPNTFVASANCVKYCGGEIVFVDIDPSTYLLDINKVRELLENSPKGTYSGIIPVDFAGRPNDLEKFRDLADEYEMWILQDSCHSPGGYFKDSKGIKQSCGNGKFAELAIFSFHPVKHIAAGEGGMITTNDKKLYERLLMLRSHGIQQNPKKRINNHGCWYYEMQELGFNYRLTDIQAALGLSQLNRAASGITKRKKIANIYYNAFKNSKFIKGQSGIIDGHAYHLYVVEFEYRNGLINFLRDLNVYAQVHYIPMHLMPYYQNLGWKEGDFPHAEKYYKHCLSLPIHTKLTKDEQSFVIDSIFDFYKKNED